MKVFEEFREYLEEKNQADFNSHKEEVKKKAIELLDNAKQVQIVLTEEGCTVQGSPASVLSAIACLVENLKDDGKIPAEVMKVVFDDIFKEEESDFEKFVRDMLS